MLLIAQLLWKPTRVLLARGPQSSLRLSVLPFILWRWRAVHWSQPLSPRSSQFNPVHTIDTNKYDPSMNARKSEACWLKFVPENDCLDYMDLRRPPQMKGRKHVKRHSRFEVMCRNRGVLQNIKKRSQRGAFQGSEGSGVVD
jgi:hypothetical protein